MKTGHVAGDFHSSTKDRYIALFVVFYPRLQIAGGAVGAGIQNIFPIVAKHINKTNTYEQHLRRLSSQTK